MAEERHAPTHQQLAWTVRRAAAESVSRKKKDAAKVGVLRLKPYPRIEFEEDGDS